MRKLSFARSNLSPASIFQQGDHIGLPKAVGFAQNANLKWRYFTRFRTTMPDDFRIQQLWSQVDFTPNESQLSAILHTDGPLFLTAGPGSGKTRVLLWRTVNLIAFRNVKPEEIFLSTFTEKAAFQLREGLRTLLGLVTNFNNTPYDLSKMYVGTVHSLCQKLIADRRFSPDRRRIQSPVLLDELSQYFHLYRPRSFQFLIDQAGIPQVEDINEFFGVV